MIGPGKTAAYSADRAIPLQSFLQTATQYSDPSDPHDPFAKFTQSWAERAAVKGVEQAFDPDRPDFLEHLLPFYDHPVYQSAPDELKQRVLSCG